MYTHCHVYRCNYMVMHCFCFAKWLRDLSSKCLTTTCLATEAEWPTLAGGLEGGRCTPRPRCHGSLPPRPQHQRSTCTDQQRTKQEQGKLSEFRLSPRNLDSLAFPREGSAPFPIATGNFESPVAWANSSRKYNMPTTQGAPERCHGAGSASPDGRSPCPSASRQPSQGPRSHCERG